MGIGRGEKINAEDTVLIEAFGRMKNCEALLERWEIGI